MGSSPADELTAVVVATSAAVGAAGASTLIHCTDQESGVLESVACSTCVGKTSKDSSDLELAHGSFSWSGSGSSIPISSIIGERESQLGERPKLVLESPRECCWAT